APGLLMWGASGFRMGTVGMLSILLFVNGIAGGMVFPASNNACIELMPEKVGTVVGLRNMFRNVGAALGISLVTFILHVSHDLTSGFTIVFIVLGLTFVVSIPLLFLMPAGRRAWG
ncbi:MAG: MFS transporter, partial [Syntrophorhabdales bacterium]